MLSTVRRTMLCVAIAAVCAPQASLAQRQPPRILPAAIRVVQQPTASVPVVFAASGDPLIFGFVHSLLLE